MSEFHKFKCLSWNYILRRFQAQKFYSSPVVSCRVRAVWTSDWLFRFLGWKPVSQNSIAPKISTKVVPEVSHLRSEFQVSTFDRFEVIAISASCGKKTIDFGRKKEKDLRREALRKSQKHQRKEK